MQQVLFWIPIRDVAEWLPALDWWAYKAAGILIIALGIRLDKRINEGAARPSHFFRILGILLGTPVIIAGAIVLLAPNNEALPIYGYGTMLFVAFLACTWLASYLGTREGIEPVRIQDMAIWIFVFGIIGARLTFMFFADPEFDWRLSTFVSQFYRVWDGGLVFYGSAVGGLVGYLIAHRLVLRKHGISPWKMADIIAPCAALGLALGRVGCLLNGCCYGNVAVCEHCPGFHFPLSSPPRVDFVKRGYQTPAGFTLKDSDTVGAVEPGRGVPGQLQAGDKIVEVNGRKVGKLDNKKNEIQTVSYLIAGDWQRGINDLDMRVVHAGGKDGEVTYRPLTLGLHPTQLYESISMLLLFFVLLAYMPLRRQPGAVMVVFMFGYGVHRFLNEMLRTDTPPVAFGLTLSQNISILVLAAASLLGVWLWIKTLRARAAAPPVNPEALSGVPAHTA